MSCDSLYERVASRGLRTIARSSDRRGRFERRVVRSRRARSRPRRRVRAPRVVATPPGGRLLFETLHGPYPQPSPDRRPRAAHRDAMTRVATRATHARATTSTSTSSRTARRDARSRRIATRAGFDLGKLASVLRKKTAMDVERVFNGTSKTRERLSAVNDVLALWRMEDFDDALEELEETLLGADFGPKAATRVTDGVRARVERGECKTGGDVRRALKASIVEVLTKAGDAMKIGLNETAGEPSVVLVVGVNGGGKTTTLGKLSHRFAESGAKVMMVPGDTFRAAAAEQLATWAERTGAMMSDSPPNTKPGAVCYKAVDEACARGDVDVVLADTSGRLHNNSQLMDELVGVKNSISKRLPSAPHEVLLVLDGTTGLNMLNQARVFNEAVGVTGIILTKLDGTSRGGAVVSVVDELGIPVKFVGVGESMQDLQSFDAVGFVDALFPDEEE